MFGWKDEKLRDEKLIYLVEEEKWDEKKCSFYKFTLMSLFIIYKK